MKTKLTLISILSGLNLLGQTITYTNFSNSLTNVLSVNIADNNSFNAILKTTTGAGVTWNAAGLTVQSGTPLVNLSYSAPSSTPYASLYPNSNYCLYDSALTTFIGYEYDNFNSDSISKWGSYEPSTAHEIYQDPDKHLIFPFNYGQSFTDNYAKTNYSNSTTISSYQTGSRTVTFNGYGTLILPQGTFQNVALISEVRTNSLGPDSAYRYTWHDISNGKILLLRNENGGSITTVWNNELPTEINEITKVLDFTIFPNPISTVAIVKINTQFTKKDLSLSLYNLIGEEVYKMQINNNETVINRNGLPNGLYIFSIKSNSRENLATGKLIFK